MVSSPSRSFKMTSTRPLSGRRVLLAEDCVDQGRLFLHYLKEAGADVVLECNGHAAVSTVERSSEEFDAIVMDFEMPKMDGIFATSKLRELGFSGAIIAATSHHSEELREAWLSVGCDAYLAKPLTKSMLIQTVSAQLNPVVRQQIS